MQYLWIGVPKFFALGLLMLTTLTGCSSSHDDDRSSALSSVPNPTIILASGGRGRPSGGLRYDVTQYGYEEHEYFFEGTAKTYPPSDQPPATYRSRMIVWTPKDRSRFNGTTIVEWAHVSVGATELTIEINDQSPMLEEQGFAFVLVSAEEGGVCSEGPNGCSASSLRSVDPERYGSLNHPGDDYSFDIFNQALQAIKYPASTAPLGRLITQFIIAEGFQFQLDRNTPLGDPTLGSPPFGGAGALNAYLASGAADARLADALFIDSAAPLVEPARYPVPTLHHLDESGIRRIPAPNSPNHITWEVVGAPHLDQWAADQVQTPTAGALSPLLSREEEEARRANFEDFGQEPGTVEQPCSTQYPRRYTADAALVALRDWLETGVPASTPPHIERVETPPDLATMKLSRDSDGNAIGGLRTPIIQVPVAAYNGEACVYLGTMTPFSPEQLAERYPTHRSYVKQLLIATNEAVASRVLLCRDAETIMRKASASTIGGNDKFTLAPACTYKTVPKL